MAAAEDSQVAQTPLNSIDDPQASFLSNQHEGTSPAGASNSRPAGALSPSLFKNLQLRASKLKALLGNNNQAVEASRDQNKFPSDHPASRSPTRTSAPGNRNEQQYEYSTANAAAPGGIRHDHPVVAKGCAAATPPHPAASGATKASHRSRIDVTPGKTSSPGLTPHHVGAAGRARAGSWSSGGRLSEAGSPWAKGQVSTPGKTQAAARESGSLAVILRDAGAGKGRAAAADHAGQRARPGASPSVQAAPSAPSPPPRKAPARGRSVSDGSRGLAGPDSQVANSITVSEAGVASHPSNGSISSGGHVPPPATDQQVVHARPGLLKGNGNSAAVARQSNGFQPPHRPQPPPMPPPPQPTTSAAASNKPSPGDSSRVLDTGSSAAAAAHAFIGTPLEHAPPPAPPLPPPAQPAQARPSRSPSPSPPGSRGSYSEGGAKGAPSPEQAPPPAAAQPTQPALIAVLEPQRSQSPDLSQRLRGHQRHRPHPPHPASAAVPAWSPPGVPHGPPHGLAVASAGHHRPESPTSPHDHHHHRHGRHDQQNVARPRPRSQAAEELSAILTQMEEEGIGMPATGPAAASPPAALGGPSASASGTPLFGPSPSLFADTSPRLRVYTVTGSGRGERSAGAGPGDGRSSTSGGGGEAGGAGVGAAAAPVDSETALAQALAVARASALAAFLNPVARTYRPRGDFKTTQSGSNSPVGGRSCGQVFAGVPAAAAPFSGPAASETLVPSPRLGLALLGASSARESLHSPSTRSPPRIGPFEKLLPLEAGEGEPGHEVGCRRETAAPGPEFLRRNEVLIKKRLAWAASKPKSGRDSEGSPSCSPRASGHHGPIRRLRASWGQDGDMASFTGAAPLAMVQRSVGDLQRWADRRERRLAVLREERDAEERARTEEQLTFKPVVGERSRRLAKVARNKYSYHLVVKPASSAALTTGGAPGVRPSDAGATSAGGSSAATNSSTAASRRRSTGGQAFSYSLSYAASVAARSLSRTSIGGQSAVSSTSPFFHLPRAAAIVGVPTPQADPSGAGVSTHRPSPSGSGLSVPLDQAVLLQMVQEGSPVVRWPGDPTAGPVLLEEGEEASDGEDLDEDEGEDSFGSPVGRAGKPRGPYIAPSARPPASAGGRGSGGIGSIRSRYASAGGVAATAVGRRRGASGPASRDASLDDAVVGSVAAAIKDARVALQLRRSSATRAHPPGPAQQQQLQQRQLSSSSAAVSTSPGGPSNQVLRSQGQPGSPPSRGSAAFEAVGDSARELGGTGGSGHTPSPRGSNRPRRGQTVAAGSGVSARRAVAIGRRSSGGDVSSGGGALLSSRSTDQPGSGRLSARSGGSGGRGQRGSAAVTGDAGGTEQTSGYPRRHRTYSNQGPDYEELLRLHLKAQRVAAAAAAAAAASTGAPSAAPAGVPGQSPAAAEPRRRHSAGAAAGAAGGSSPAPAVGSGPASAAVGPASRARATSAAAVAVGSSTSPAASGGGAGEITVAARPPAAAALYSPAANHRDLRTPTPSGGGSRGGGRSRARTGSSGGGGAEGGSTPPGPGPALSSSMPTGGSATGFGSDVSGSGGGLVRLRASMSADGPIVSPPPPPVFDGLHSTGPSLTPANEVDAGVLPAGLFVRVPQMPPPRSGRDSQEISRPYDGTTTAHGAAGGVAVGAFRHGSLVSSPASSYTTLVYEAGGAAGGLPSSPPLLTPSASSGGATEAAHGPFPFHDPSLRQADGSLVAALQGVLRRSSSGGDYRGLPHPSHPPGITEPRDGAHVAPSRSTRISASGVPSSLPPLPSQQSQGPHDQPAEGRAAAALTTAATTTTSGSVTQAGGRPPLPCPSPAASTAPPSGPHGSAAVAASLPPSQSPRHDTGMGSVLCRLAQLSADSPRLAMPPPPPPLSAPTSPRAWPSPSPSTGAGIPLPDAGSSPRSPWGPRAAAAAGPPLSTAPGVLRTATSAPGSPRAGGSGGRREGAPLSLALAAMGGAGSPRGAPPEADQSRAELPYNRDISHQFANLGIWPVASTGGGSPARQLIPTAAAAAVIASPDAGGCMSAPVSRESSFGSGRKRAGDRSRSGELFGGRGGKKARDGDDGGEASAAAAGVGRFGRKALAAGGGWGIGGVLRTEARSVSAPTAATWRGRGGTYLDASSPRGSERDLPSARSDLSRASSHGSRGRTVSFQLEPVELGPETRAVAVALSPAATSPRSPHAASPRYQFHHAPAGGAGPVPGAHMGSSGHGVGDSGAVAAVTIRGAIAAAMMDAYRAGAAAGAAPAPAGALDVSGAGASMAAATGVLRSSADGASAPFGTPFGFALAAAAPVSSAALTRGDAPSPNVGAASGTGTAAMTSAAAAGSVAGAGASPLSAGRPYSPALSDDDPLSYLQTLIRRVAHLGEEERRATASAATSPVRPTKLPTPDAVTVTSTAHTVATAAAAPEGDDAVGAGQGVAEVEALYEPLSEPVAAVVAVEDTNEQRQTSRDAEEPEGALQAVSGASPLGSGLESGSAGDSSRGSSGAGAANSDDAGRAQEARGSGVSSGGGGSVAPWETHGSDMVRVASRGSDSPHVAPSADVAAVSAALRLSTVPSSHPVDLGLAASSRSASSAGGSTASSTLSAHTSQGGSSHSAQGAVFLASSPARTTASPTLPPPAPAAPAPASPRGPDVISASAPSVASTAGTPKQPPSEGLPLEELVRRAEALRAAAMSAAGLELPSPVLGPSPAHAAAGTPNAKTTSTTPAPSPIGAAMASPPPLPSSPFAPPCHQLLVTAAATTTPAGGATAAAASPGSQAPSRRTTGDHTTPLSTPTSASKPTPASAGPGSATGTSGTRRTTGGGGGGGLQQRPTPTVLSYGMNAPSPNATAAIGAPTTKHVSGTRRGGSLSSGAGAAAAGARGRPNGAVGVGGVAGPQAAAGLNHGSGMSHRPGGGRGVRSAGSGPRFHSAAGGGAGASPAGGHSAATAEPEFVFPRLAPATADGGQGLQHLHGLAGGAAGAAAGPGGLGSAGGPGSCSGALSDTDTWAASSAASLDEEGLAHEISLAGGLQQVPPAFRAPSRRALAAALAAPSASALAAAAALQPRYSVWSLRDHLAVAGDRPPHRHQGPGNPHHRNPQLAAPPAAAQPEPQGLLHQEVPHPPLRAAAARDPGSPSPGSSEAPSVASDEGSGDETVPEAPESDSLSCVVPQPPPHLSGGSDFGVGDGSGSGGGVPGGPSSPAAAPPALDDASDALAALHRLIQQMTQL